VADGLAIAALSARMMAESARRGGFSTTALDLFGDADTRRVVDHWSCAGAADSLRLDAERVASALAACSRSASFVGWVAGAGFEAASEALVRGAAIARLLGNDPHTIVALRTPREFFGRLSKLGMPHPAVAWEAPAAADGWLYKDARGCGGWHIRPARAADPSRRHVDDGGYYQRIHTGTPMSALFIGDGKGADVVGISEQIVRARGARPYVYHGAIGPVPTSVRVARDIGAFVQAIVREWRLAGLNGVDFLLDGERIVVLEVNPRPTATMTLYDPAFPRGLMRAHVDACLTGSLPAAVGRVEPGQPLRGHSIVFADEAVAAVSPSTCERLLALRFVHDVPLAGVSIPAGAPLCSVSAEGRSAADVRAALEDRARQVIGTVVRGRAAELRESG